MRPLKLAAKGLHGPEVSAPLPAPRTSVSERFVVWVLPVVAASLFLVVAAVEGISVKHDLQVIIPTTASRGELLPVRAWVFGPSEPDAPPIFEEATITVDVRDVGESVLARVELRPSARGTKAGFLRLPRTRDASFELVATARRDGRVLAQAFSHVAIDDAPAPLQTQGRLGSDLGRMAYDSKGGRVVPRVVGAYCSPEARCECLVLLAPGCAIESVSPGTLTRRSAALAEVAVDVQGPEPTLTVHARCAEEAFATTIRLPLALGVPAIEVPAIVALGEPVTISAKTTEVGRDVFVDAISAGRWRYASSVSAEEAASHAPQPLELAAGEPGLWQLMARTDPFSADAAAVRAFFVGDVESEAASRLIEPIVAGDDEVAALLEAHERAGAPLPHADRMALGLAILDESIFLLPDAISGHDVETAALAAVRVRVRWLALLGLGVLFLGVIALLLRRGLGAGVEAATLLDRAGADPDVVRRARRRSVLTVLSWSAAMTLVFLAAIVMAMLRRFFQ